MTITQMLFLGVLFAGVFGGALLLLRLYGGNRVRDRLNALDDRQQHVEKKTEVRWLAHIVNLTAPLAKLSLPAEGWETSPIRKRFINAGWRTPSVPAIFYGTKTGLALFLPLVLFLALKSKADGPTGGALLFCLLGIAGLGYYLPDFVLSRTVANRQRDLFENFPDALDLMTVCVEAGLAMDAALARVAAEIGLKSVVLAEELQLVTLELRAGSAKEKALRNLALRTGVDDIDALVTMLIQAERFGTSIADSLRVQSDQLRTKRRQRAEEAAAKIALKLLFPLIFFIFPSLLVILLGPAMLQVARALAPAFGADGG
jgi:tight adherence protein C